MIRGDSVIEIDKVSVAIGDVTLLPEVSARAKKGSALILRGRNGTGKSTLLRVLAGTQQPTSGTARVAGGLVDDRSAAFRRAVASMVGLPPLAHDLTLVDHLTLVASTWTADAAAATRTARAVLDELGLAALAERFPHELSSGQTQLFGLALTLARPFEVLLLDEPEQRLDADHITAVAEALLARIEAGATIVVATHSAQLTDALAGPVLSLDAA
ncbi:MAG: ATP-binding cassette domain-containing protein [Demequina sp.]|uniref:ABC transporter ATP-binding protein n=1 Tax=Demequina sp. TaxID=2050685 RepID=UPI003A8B368A